ncbi:MAG: hypothetical protein JW737_05715 [Acidobacteria bacterium]|nr:hypothetical protein [Acidobacteriota bacterium]
MKKIIISWLAAQLILVFAVGVIHAGQKNISIKRKYIKDDKAYYTVAIIGAPVEDIVKILSDYTGAEIHIGSIPKDAPTLNIEFMDIPSEYVDAMVDKMGYTLTLNFDYGKDSKMKKVKKGDGFTYQTNYDFSEKKLSLEFDNVRLVDILQTISSGSGYTIKVVGVSDNRIVSMKVYKVTVPEALAALAEVAELDLKKIDDNTYEMRARK